MKYSLTKTQQQALTFIKEYYAEHNTVPSVREIAANGGRVLSGGKRVLDGLINRGAILKGKAGAPRSYVIADSLDADTARLRRGFIAADDFVDKQKTFRRAYEDGKADEGMSLEVQNAFQLLADRVGDVA